MRYMLSSEQGSVYVQKMATGHVWDGVAPPNEKNEGHADVGVFNKGVFEVPVDSVTNHGGLFDFENNRPIEIIDIEFYVPAGTTGWTISKVTATGDIVRFSDTTTGNIVVSKGTDEMPRLAPGETLKIVTTGTPATASFARITSKIIQI